MTLAQIATMVFEPRTSRYVGRHRAPEVTTSVAVAAPRTLVSAVSAVAAARPTAAAPAAD
jgi:hypothetical protein